MNILVLFGKDWEEDLLRPLDKKGQYQFFFEGFDLFSFPSNAHLLNFSMLSFVTRMAKKYAGRIEAVVSTNEQFGALAASLIAEKLGLPSPKPEAILRAQHKYALRILLEKIAPEANVRSQPFPYAINHAAQIELPFPFYVKPLKATFSVLARRIDNFAQLKQHLTFKTWEKFIIKRLVRPFNDILRARGFSASSTPIDAHHMLAEEVITGTQLNVDAYMAQGQFHLIGVVDALMYPNTQAFLRFAYPSKQSPEMQLKIAQLVEKIARALEFDNGFFNVELLITQAGEIKVIEVNPRMAAQTIDVIRRVTGIDYYTILFSIAAGHAVQNSIEAGRKPEATAAASFVFRRFDGGSLEHQPSVHDWEWLHRHFHDARLLLFAKKKGGLQREMKWLGSHRYAVLNVAGKDEADLRMRYEAICSRLGWPSQY